MRSWRPGRPLPSAGTPISITGVLTQVITLAPGETRIVGWRAIQQLQLEGEDFGEVTALVTELQQKLQVRSMEFMPTRDTRKRVENELTTQALKAFAARAQLIAGAMGSSRYEVVELAVGSAPRPYQPR